MIGEIRNQKRWDRAERRRKARKQYRIDRVPRTKRCPFCGGKMTWCEGCGMWSKTCCQDWGSCQCN